MKKLLIIMLALLMTFSFVACGETGDGGSGDGGSGDEKGSEETISFDEFVAAYSATVPVKITVNTKLTTVLGDLNSTVETVFNPNGSSTINYSYEAFNEISDSAETKSVISGTVECDKNGNYSDGGEFVGQNSTVTGIKLNLDASLMECSINGDVLTANIKAENVKAVTGVDFGADVVLMITKSAGKIISVTANYSSANGPVSIVCSYTN